MSYDHQSIEKKWQQFWRENQTFKAENWGTKPKKFVLDMFPYPSGAGLHVGHPKGYTATDILSRFYHARGFNVLHPMGFDAFGLPAENYAIKTGTHPAVTTAANIETFIEQLHALGFSYDWDRMVDTTDPEYYKWTQWIFLELFKHGLAYEQDLPINYCPSCKTGLANEEVLSDHTCDRCGTVVEKRKIRQWVLAITEYAERLLSDIDELDWSDGIKEMQRNWIGKSEGCEFEMQKSDDTSNKIRVYTTRVDTVFGMTYAVLAPDHPDVNTYITDNYRTISEQYIADSKKKSDQDRTNEWKEKTGVFTGSYVINPYNGESVPLWIADYVLGSYGTWAVMAVPAHDERDFAFAKKYNLPIRQSIELSSEFLESEWKSEYTLDGKVIAMDSVSSSDARTILIERAEKEGFGHKKVNYKLRDWLFSRQRYWGEPIPLIHISNEDYEKLPRVNDISEAINPKIAYIFDKKGTDKRCKNCTCEDGCTKLIIWGKTFSKVYDGINSKIIIDSSSSTHTSTSWEIRTSRDGQSPLATVPDWVNVHSQIISQEIEKLIPCLNGVDLVGIISAIWITKIQMPLQAKKHLSIGEQSMNMLEVQNMRYFIFSMLVFGTRYSMISELFRPKNHSRSLSIKEWSLHMRMNERMDDSLRSISLKKKRKILSKFRLEKKWNKSSQRWVSHSKMSSIRMI
jgi:valyl-tRNA synthetase